MEPTSLIVRVDAIDSDGTGPISIVLSHGGGQCRITGNINPDEVRAIMAWLDGIIDGPPIVAAIAATI